MKDFEVLSDVSQLKAIAHSDRLAILRRLQTATLSGSQLAQELELPANRVHYHLKQLESVGLVEVERRGRKRWREELFYRATARNFLVAPEVTVEARTVREALESHAEEEFSRWRREDRLGIELAEIAKRVVHDCLAVQPGERVLITVGPFTLALAEALAVELEATGAVALPKLWSRQWIFSTLDRNDVSDLEHRRFLPTDLENMLDACIHLSSNRPQGGPPSEGQRAKLPHIMASVARWQRSLGERHVPYVEVALPYAGEFTRDGAIDEYWRALTVTPEELRRTGNRLVSALGDARELRILTAENATLDVRLGEEEPQIEAGRVDRDAARVVESLPAGALDLPVEVGTAVGQFMPSTVFYRGRRWSGVTLGFEEGALVEVRGADDGADLLERLRAESGDATRLSGLSIGLNPAGDRPTGKPGLDLRLRGAVSVKIGGDPLAHESTIHLLLPAFGATITTGDRIVVDRGSVPC